MSELLLKEVLFAGKSELDQMDKIFRLLGTPSSSNWPGHERLPGWPKVRSTPTKLPSLLCPLCEY